MKHEAVNSYAELKKRAELKPGAKAVFARRWYSNREFLSTVQKASAWLKHFGVKAGDGVALCFEPSIEALAMVFATQQLGAFFVPISSRQPQKLGNKMHLQSGASLFVCSRKFKERYPQSHIFDQEWVDRQKPYTAAHEGQLSYLMFTSGSTGDPKGVKITTKNLGYILHASSKTYPCSDGEAYVWTTGWTFDVSITQLFGWIRDGGALVIPDSADSNALTELPSLIQTRRVTHLCLAPTVLAAYLRAWSLDQLASIRENLRFLMIAGEVFPRDLAIHIKDLFPKTHVLNLYGPTEATVYATQYEVQGNESSGSLPIGRSLPGAETLILDDHQEAVKPGEIGEIYILGEGVAQGYCSDADTASGKFSPIRGKPAYRTGDFGRLLESGDIEFHGRRDRQVQIHGVRVELGEVEAALGIVFTQPGQVRVLESNGRLLCFFIGNDEDVSRLKEEASRKLANYATPVAYHGLTEFPSTPSGKLDTDKLLKFAGPATLGRAEPPAGASADKPFSRETILDELIKLFNIAPTMTDLALSSFGLDSLELMVGLAQIQQKFHVAVPESILFGAKSLKDLASEILSRTTAGAALSKTALYPASSGSSPELTNLKSLIARWVEATSALVKGSSWTFETHALQKTYFYDDFKSALDLEMVFEDPHEADLLAKSLDQVINDSELLRSVLCELGQKLLFRCSQRLSLETPEISSGLEYSQAQSWLSELKKMLHDLTSQNVPGRVLHIPVIVRFKNATVLIWSLSHMICDQSTVFLLKRKIARGLTEGNHPAPNSYSSFVSFLGRNSDPAEMAHLPWVQQLLALEQKLTPEIETQKPPEKMTLKIQRSRSTPLRIAEICFEVARKCAEAWQVHGFGLSTLLNIRKFNGFDAEEIVGDCHSTFPLPFNITDSWESFVDRFEQIYELYRKGSSPFYAAFANYPKMNENQRLLEKACDLIPILKINYLGPLAERDRPALLESLQTTKKALMAFPGKRIFVTAFDTEGGETEIYFLTAPKGMGSC